MLPINTEEEIHLRDYWRVVQKRKWTVITLFAVVVTTVTILSFKATPIYRATAQILIDKENPNVVSVAEVYTLRASDMDYYQTQYKLLQSRTLVKMIVESMNLIKSPEFKAEEKGFNLKEYLISLFNTENSTILKSDNENSKLIDAYLGRLKVEPVKNSRLINISFEGKDPEAVTKIINNHAKAYIEHNLENRFSATADALKWLDERSGESRKKVEESELSLQRYMEKLALVSLDEKQNIVVQKLSELSSEVRNAETSRIGLETLYNQMKTLSQLPEMVESLPAVFNNPLIQSLKTEYLKLQQEYSSLSKNTDKPESVPEIIDNSLIQQLKMEIIKLHAKESELKEKYGEKHPQMVKLSSEIDLIKKKIEKESDTIIKGIGERRKVVEAQLEIVKKRLSLEIEKITRGMETEYRVALAKEDSLKRSLEQQKHEALDLNAKSIQYGALKREAESNKNMYDMLIKRMKETSLATELKTSNIRVVDWAEVPDNPVKPKKKQNILISVATGLFMGIFLAFFFEYLDNTIKTPDDVERFLKIPNLGLIGLFKPATANPHSGELITLKDPKSNIAENFRTLRTNIVFSTPADSPTAIVITSSIPGEGKTLISSNLAVTMANLGKKVLLIDADLRKPRLHKMFGIKSARGLSNILIGEGDYKEIVHTTDVENLSIITSGPVPPNPSELLSSQKMEGLLQELLKIYDRIIIDTPPIASVADAVIISKMVNATVIVIKSGNTSVENISYTIKLLNEVKTKVIGGILNAVDFKRDAYYYQYYHQYYKYYGDNKEKRQV